MRQFCILNIGIRCYNQCKDGRPSGGSKKDLLGALRQSGVYFPGWKIFMAPLDLTFNYRDTSNEEAPVTLSRFFLVCMQGRPIVPTPGQDRSFLEFFNTGFGSLEEIAACVLPKLSRRFLRFLQTAELISNAAAENG